MVKVRYDCLWVSDGTEDALAWAVGSDSGSEALGNATMLSDAVELAGATGQGLMLIQVRHAVWTLRPAPCHDGVNSVPLSFRLL